MKYQEKKVGSLKEVFEYVKEAFSSLSKGQLKVEDETAFIPGDKDLDYKVKYENDEADGSFSVKISWANIAEVEEEDEDEDEKEEVED